MPKNTGIEPDIKYDCDICNKNFLTKVHLQTHKSSCMKNTNYIRSEVQATEYKELESKYNSLIINSNEKYNKLEFEYIIKYKELESKYNLIIDEKNILSVKYNNLLDKITNSAISKTNTNTNTVNKHNNTINISTYTRTDDEIKNI
jgi:hypothetical protein